MAETWLTSEVPAIRHILHRNDARFRGSGGTYDEPATRRGPRVAVLLELLPHRTVEARYYGGDFFDVVYAGRVYTFPWDLAT